jgi:mono/diheme cytochrome c family protein
MIAAAPDDPLRAPIIVRQMATGAVIEPQPAGYGGAPNGDADPTMSCGPSIVRTVVERRYRTPLDGSVGMTAKGPRHAVLPVDVAIDGTNYVLVAAGNAHTNALPEAFVIARDGDCFIEKTIFTVGQTIAVAVRGSGQYLFQSREPARLEIYPESFVIPLADDSREDTGHAIFHSNSGSGLACASCHGEGGDDGNVWHFDKLGSRRTPSLRGTLDGTAPYHWDGAMKDISQLADEVMTGRMNGPPLAVDQKSALQSWLFALPAPSLPAPSDPAAVARGKALFESADVGCATCHSGPKLTSSATVDVGTGGAFQVPSLVGVSARAPFLHDGCAATLADRFLSCGSPQHGRTSQLTAAEVDDLVAYLSTL